MIVCDAAGCVRGIVHLVDGFGDPCKICGGAGKLSLSTVAKRIDENESTLRKVWKTVLSDSTGHLTRSRHKMRVKVAARICAKLVSLTAPPKQPSLF